MHNLEHLLRDLAPQVLGAIVLRYRDFSAAEAAVQEGLIASAMLGPTEGLPNNPWAWLIHVAVRRMTGQFRNDSARRRHERSPCLLPAGRQEQSSIPEHNYLLSKAPTSGKHMLRRVYYP